jgi:hypothetical protein
MLRDEVMDELHKLSRADKLRVVQFLVNDLAAGEENLLTTNSHYEVWSPYDSAEAAATLMQMLEEDQQSNND